MPCCSCRQPAPPDTPEHGAVLRLFIKQAHKQVHGELKEHTSLAEAARKGTAAKSTKLHKLWGHAGSSSKQQQQQQDAPGPPATDLLPPPGKVRSWPLSPHIDLRLQLPSQQLLEHLVLRVLDHERQQEAAEQGQQGRDQYQQADETQQPSNCSEQDDSLQQLLQQFAERLQQQQGQDDAASAFGALLDKSLVESLRQGLLGPAHCQNSSSSSSKSPPGQNEVSVGAAGDTHGSSSRPSALSSDNAAAAASAAEQARRQGRLPQELCSAATSLAARCVLEQVALGWQQWLPLQALQLLTAVQQLEATARAACATRPPESQALATVAQQHLVQQSLLLLQHVQDLRDAREPAATVAAAAAAASSAAEPTQHNNSSSSSSSSHWAEWHQQSGSSTAGANAGCLSPAQFFAADGPLAGGPGCEPTGLGLWQHTGTSCQSAASGHNMGSSSCSDGSSTSSQGSSSSSTACAGPGPNQVSDSQLPQQPCKQLVGLAQATALSHILQKCVTQLLCGSILHAAMANRPFNELHDADAIELKGSALLSLVLAEIKQHSGRVCAAGMTYDALIVMWALPRAMAVAVAQLRELLCERLGLPGYDAVAWSNIMHQAELHSSAELQKAREGPFSRGPDSDSDSDGMIDSDSEDGADEDGTAAGMAGWWSSSSSSGATGGAEALRMQHLLRLRLQHDGELLRPVQAMLQQHETGYKRDQDTIKQAAVSLRCV